MESTRAPLGQFDLEVGYADVMQPHPVKTPAHHQAPPNWLFEWEDRRPRLLIEMCAEAIGVFMYCYLGIGATVTFYVASAAKETGFGSLLSVALAYGCGICLAITTVGQASGGHLSPCYTITFALFKGFPWKKVPFYIAAQIFGAFCGTLACYGAYRHQLDAVASALTAAGEGAVIFSPLGPAGALALFPGIGVPIKYIFVNEFVANVFLSIVVFSVLDSSNIFVSYVSAPIIISLAYIAAILAFGANSLVLNTARDLGARLAVAAVYPGGRVGAFPPAYTALACLVNILATPIGAAIQTLLLSDSARPTVSNLPDPEGPSLRVLTRDNISLRAVSRDGEKST